MGYLWIVGTQVSMEWLSETIKGQFHFPIKNV